MTPREYADALRKLGKEELPKVAAAVVTRLAVAGQGAQARALGRDFTLRNKWTLGSLRTWKAKPMANIDRINAVTGTVSPYLDEQEVGGTETNKDGTPTRTTPSLTSRGRNWQKPISARFRWSALRNSKNNTFVLKPRSGAAVLSRKRQASRRAIRQAIIVQRTGVRTLKKLRVVNRSDVHLKATHWHERAMDRLTRPELFQAAFNDEMGKALARLGAMDA